MYVSNDGVISTGIVDEILNRLKFQTPLGATILQDGTNQSKPAVHYVDADDKLVGELKVKKGCLQIKYASSL